MSGPRAKKRTQSKSTIKNRNYLVNDISLCKIINMCGAGAGTGDWGQGVGGQREVKGGSQTLQK